MAIQYGNPIVYGAALASDRLLILTGQRLDCVGRKAEEEMTMNEVRAFGIRRWLYWFMAGMFFTLAMVGVALPGIPTTPFLLLMCFFLSRVSPAMHAKAMTWPIVGGPLQDWHDQGGVRREIKSLAIVMVLLMVGSTMVFSPLPLAIKMLILLAASYGVSIVWRLPTAAANDEVNI